MRTKEFVATMFGGIGADPNSNSIVTDLIQKSSDRLREHFDLSDTQTIQEPIPRFVTRKDPSLDNYLADLLLRTCYAPSNTCPDFVEIVMRGSDVDLPTEMNPRVAGAVLIGIGSMSRNPDIVAVYDEHIERGARKAPSASQVVFDAHLAPLIESRPRIKKLFPVLDEINRIDSGGMARQNHLNTITKDLHYARYRRPGYVVQEFPDQWKRAVVSATLAAACTVDADLLKIDAKAAAKRLRDEWKTYRVKKTPIVEAGFLGPISDRTLDQKLGQTTGGQDPANLLTLRRVLFAMDRTWPRQVVSFVMSFWFEPMLQLQDEFLKMKEMQISEVRIGQTEYRLLYYVMAPGDMKPHRGILHRLNGEGKSAVLVIRDSYRQAVAVFKSDALPSEVWETFVELVPERELQHETGWYIPTDKKTGRLATFLLNGTRYNLAAMPTTLGREDFVNVLREACRAVG